MKIDVKFTLRYEIKDDKILLQAIPDIPKDFDFEYLDKFLKVYKPVASAIEEYKLALQKIGDSFLNSMEQTLNKIKNSKK